jgi:hypothetical protein
MNTQEIEQALDELKDLRFHAEDLAAAKRMMIEEVKTQPEYRALEEANIEALRTIEQYELDIRAAVLEHYNADAAIPDRTQVKLFTVVQIPDELKAKEWSIAHFTPALKLDAKVFEKAAKDGNIPADLATVTKEPRAQISTKL